MSSRYLKTLAKRKGVDIDDTFEAKQVLTGKRKKIFQPIESYCKVCNFCADILDVGGRTQTSGFRYVTLVLDIYSRYCIAAIPTNFKREGVKPKRKRKTKVSEIKGNKLYPDVWWSSLAPLLESYKPINFNTDGEKAWIQKAFYEKNGIEHHVSPYGNHTKNSICERFNRTFREMIVAYKTANRVESIPLEAIEEIRQDYNGYKHRTTGQIPRKVWESAGKYKKSVTNKPAARINPFDTIKDPFQVGDHVRINRLAILNPEALFFEKGTEAKWSSDVYEIVQKRGVTYNTKDNTRGRTPKVDQISDKLYKVKNLKTGIVLKAKKKDGSDSQRINYIRWSDMKRIPKGKAKLLPNVKRPKVSSNLLQKRKQNKAYQRQKKVFKDLEVGVKDILKTRSQRKAKIKANEKLKKQSRGRRGKKE